mmetsp:Transcript_13909/g.20530  ORF Transcript_13909/g.20530 Transcript_13909/m.20530 type:complete len:316 (-) Transcript_13909:4249-5196(-)
MKSSTEERRDSSYRRKRKSRKNTCTITTSATVVPPQKKELLPRSKEQLSSFINPTSKRLKTVCNSDIAPQHAFGVDERDHCETPLDAYKDIVQILDFVAKSLGKKRCSLRIYDPYFCNGGVKDKLKSLGFLEVINENKDFYHDIKHRSIPDHDIIVTNPPYSGKHIETLLRFSASNTKPFLLLLPHFVYTKQYYGSSLLKQASKVFFLVPSKRYSYAPPSWVSSSTGSTALAKGKFQTAPFPSFWYCRAPFISNSWLSKFIGPSGRYDPKRKLHYANCTDHIPLEAKGEFDASKKRPNPRARKRAAERRRKAKSG